MTPPTLTQRPAATTHLYFSDVKTRLDNEIQQLVKDIWRVGDPLKPQVPFGELFDDDDVQQHYEGLAATLKAAKKREFGPSCNTTSRRLFYLLFYVFSFY